MCGSERRFQARATDVPLVWHLAVLQGQRAFRIRLYGNNGVKEIHSLHADEVVGDYGSWLESRSILPPGPWRTPERLSPYLKVEPWCATYRQ